MTAREYRRLTPEQKQAADWLEFGVSDAAERARLKLVLGRKRIPRTEMSALAHRLVSEKVTRSAIRDALHVTERHLQRLLTEPDDHEGQNPEKPPRKPISHAANSDTKTPPKAVTCRGHSPAPIAGFATFADLDHWLDEREVAA